MRIIWYFLNLSAGVAQLVEYKLPKLGVAGSNPVARSKMARFKLIEALASTC